MVYKFSSRQSFVALAIAVTTGLLAFTIYQNQTKGAEAAKRLAKENSELTMLTAKLEALKVHASKVGPAELEVYVKAPGVIDFHPKRALRIHPSFSGVITQVFKNLGDKVEIGQALAAIESNTGMQVYTVTSPIRGIILSRDASVGQSVIPENELFSVGDSSVLQARIAVSAQDVALVRTGQETVLVAADQTPMRAKIGFLSPILSEETRTATAVIDIPGIHARAGMFVTGAIIVGKTTVELALPLKFCEQSPDGAFVSVIVPKGLDRRHIVFGKADYLHCQVLSGLSEGELVLSQTDIALENTPSDEDAHEGEHEIEHPDGTDGNTDKVNVKANTNAEKDTHDHD